MHKGHHIHVAKLKAENEQLKGQTQYQVIVHHPPDEMAALHRRIRELEQENSHLNEQIERLLRMAEQH